MGELSWPRFTPKHSCLKCHFLAKSQRLQSGFGEPRPWSREDRNIPWLSDDLDTAVSISLWRSAWKPSCYKGIWQVDPAFGREGLSDDEDQEELEELEGLITSNRRDECFFIKYNEGMKFDTASELHRIRYDTRHLRLGYLLTIIGLWIAALAAAANAYFQYIKLPDVP